MFLEKKGSGTYLVALVRQLSRQPLRNVINSFALSHIEFKFGKEVSWDDRSQPHTLCHGKMFAMETRVKPQ